MALIGMRLRGYAVTGRALAPLLAGLVVLGTLYGGGRAQAGEAYGVSAVVLLPVLAWQTKLLLDGEPDVQRRLAAVALGSGRREVLSGLIAAVAAAIPIVGLAMVVPWLLGGITGPEQPGDAPLGTGIALGIWAHLLLVPPAVVLGALASRAVTRSAGRGVTTLATGVVLVLVLGLRGSPAPWLVPPAMAVARLASAADPGRAVLTVTGWAVAWTVVAGAGYLGLRTFAVSR